MYEKDRILHALLDLSEAMIMNGLEIDRVERGLDKLGAAYQLSRVELLVLNAGLACTITAEDGSQVTQARRIQEPSGVNCTKAERLEHLGKACIANPLPPDELSRKVAEIVSERGNLVGEYVGSIIGVAGLTIGFGGRPQDALVAALIAALIAFIRSKTYRYFPNTLVFNVAAALVAGLCACGLEALFGGLLLDKILSGIVMMLIPGMAFTLGMRNVLMGETAAGAMRLIEALFWGLGLACGIIGSLCITGVYTEIADPLSLEGWGFAVKLVTAYASAFGFGLMNHLPVRYLTLAPLVGMVACGVCVVLEQQPDGTFLANFCAGAFAAICANLLARYFDTSSISIIVPAIMPLVPGSLLFFSMCCGVAGEMSLCASYFQQMLVVAFSLSAGMCSIWAVQAIVRKVQASHQA